MEGQDGWRWMEGLVEENNVAEWPDTGGAGLLTPVGSC